MNDKEEKDTVKLLRQCDAGIKMGIGGAGVLRPSYQVNLSNT